MANETVKYHNDLNTIIMRRWTKEELNLFFAVLSKAKEKNSRILKIERDELRALINFKPTSNNRLEEVIKSSINKISTVTYFEDTTNVYEVFLIFNKFRYDKINHILEVKLNEEYDYILNRLTANFTIFELSEYVGLSSTYSKTMYRLLKQWRTIGVKKFAKNELYLLLDVPKSTQTTANFTNRVLNPIMDELKFIFKGLKIEPIRARKQGRPITHYVFSWQAEQVGVWVDNKYGSNKGKKTKKVKELPNWINETPQKSVPADPKKVKELQDKIALLTKKT
jgi:plasmid replication initiation protein